MLVLNAAGPTPISLLKPTTRSEPKRLFPSKFSRGLNTALAALSSVLYTNGLAKSLTYEEVLNRSMSSSSDFDLGQFLDEVVRFSSENRLIIGGGVAVLIVPLILSQVLKEQDKNWGVENAKVAYSKLAEDVEAQLLDIREGKEFMEVGSPNVRILKKKAVAITYKGVDKNGFLEKLKLKFKDPGSTTLFILDKFDGNSKLVAELVAANGFKAAYAIKDGAEGPRGWKNSGLPWSPLKKGTTLDFGDLKDAITSALGDKSDGVPVTLGLAAATGLGLFIFTELLGTAGAVQFATKKLLFAEDRKVTLQQVEEFLNANIAPKELDEFKTIGKSLLPEPVSSKSLPVSMQENQDPSTPTTPVLKADPFSETKPELKEEAGIETPKAVNSITKSEVSDESVTRLSQPLSPYSYYPDFKLPSSPSPAKP